ncbi:sodium- and chloride-dependent glycine transporter 2-like isoform X2 [Ostrinia nubilalis]|uniref:sodium- and chloride-dependent glycine transporter 2-like isoform X2 n=1 Tax=Ostrinia nubilalis TaxID=29057 RepID=UPI0030825330
MRAKLVTVAMDHVTYAYGIGFVGVYDFGTMSPYTMVDNAVVIFTLIFTLSAFARSLIIKILHVVLTSCVEIEISITPHYLLFAILPFSTEFFYAHKLYVVYIYVNVMLATMAYLALLTLSMSKLLHSEFRSVKNLYIVGILCFWGFVFSVPITVQSTVSKSSLQGLIYGIKVSVLYLGGFKVAIVMWMYGVGRFSTDIHYWLGFKPTKFWSMCWMFLPVVLFSFSINRIVILITQKKDIAEILAASLWIAFSALVVTIIQIKTVVKYLVRNNISKAFTSSSKYGPPDSDDRKQRRTYNETIRLRQCIHNCNVLDDSFDCNHLPLLHKTRSRLSSSSGSNPSIKNIFEAENKKRHSDIVEAFE